MSKNDITGDEIKTKPSSTYADNYDRIFGKKTLDMKVTMTGRSGLLDSYDEVEQPLKEEYASPDKFLYWAMFDFEVAIKRYGVTTVLNQLKPETMEAIQYAIASGRSSP